MLSPYAALLSAAGRRRERPSLPGWCGAVLPRGWCVWWDRIGAMTVIDVWMQHPTERLLQQEMFASLRRWTGSGIPTGAMPVEVTVAAMDQVAATVAHHPDRFTGVASVDLRQPVPAVAELRRTVHELGFRGLRIVTWLWGTATQPPPVLFAADRVRTPRHPVPDPGRAHRPAAPPLRPSETGRPIPYLDDVALDFPDLVIIVGHIPMVAVTRWRRVVDGRRRGSGAAGRSVSRTCSRAVGEAERVGGWIWCRCWHDVGVLICSLGVRDLLSFESLEVCFHEGLNVVVGQNGVGKSNLVRLVRLMREIVSATPGVAPAYGFEQRFVRLRSPGRGRLGVRIRFTEPDERARLLLFVRAVAAQAAEPVGSPEPLTPDQLAARYQRNAAFVEECLGDKQISGLFEGQLVLDMDARQPARWSLGYEFEHQSTTFHLGLQGRSVTPGVVARGPLDLDRAIWTTARLDMSGKMAPDSSDWKPVSFQDLLPSISQPTAWQLEQVQNNVQRPLALQLARELGLAADNSKIPNIQWVLRDLIGRAVVTTENLRRPPRRAYELDEVRSGLAVEDAGDLPLELYRRKNGSPEQRARYAGLQRSFQAMTGRRLDLAASFTASPTDTAERLDVMLQVETPAGWVPIENAGAGLWEALAALAVVVSEPGQVVLLDEPATHLHSSWQRQLLRDLTEHHQVVMVTHSPFLVPTLTSDDFTRVTRLAVSDGKVNAVSVGRDDVPTHWRERWRQIFAGSTDARDVLFSRGVILVEGDTEVGAFRHWFNDPAVVDSIERGAEARNLGIISVDGDGNFGPWVSYLHQMSIQWAVLADGPALSPDHKNSLMQQLGPDSQTGERSIRLSARPPQSADFAEWRAYWATNGVYTVAETFGIKSTGHAVEGDSEKSGEIERWLSQLDPGLWANVKAATTSKVRRGYRFAEQLDLTTHTEATKKLQQLWTTLLSRIDPADSPTQPDDQHSRAGDPTSVT
jgi:hypothetical protein